MLMLQTHVSQCCTSIRVVQKMGCMALTRGLVDTAGICLRRMTKPLATATPTTLCIRLIKVHQAPNG
jgi:hypothetical protein